MNAVTIARVLMERRALRSHERWTRARLDAHQTNALRELRALAYANAPFYRRFHQGRYDAPLNELPVLTKAQLMDEFDDIVTDRRLRLADIRAYLDAANEAPYLGRYRIASTSGTTGLRGVFVTSDSEWISVLASYARANDWAGVTAGLTSRMRLAVVGSRNPAHQSAIVGASLRSWWVPTLRIDALDPLDRIVTALNEFQPHTLAGYSSMLRVLSEAQLNGDLRIAPRAVMSSSEVLTDAAARAMERAWGHRPFNTYAVTETAGLAAECREGRRMHLYEDLVIIEVVDELDRPVPPGTYGARLLATVLFNRTQPLIRYEISDCVRPSISPCACGRPFSCIDGIEGRLRDVLEMAGTGGGRVSLHPHVFYRVLDPIGATGWQVVQEPDGRLRLLLADADGVDDQTLISAVSAALADQGAVSPPMTVERVTAIPRTALGKAPFVRAADTVSHAH